MFGLSHFGSAHFGDSAPDPLRPDSSLSTVEASEVDVMRRLADELLIADDEAYRRQRFPETIYETPF
jgi:hypothetical protein